MLHKNLISLTLITLSVITATQAQASEFIIPSDPVKSPCNVHNNPTLKQQHLPSICSQAREEDEEKILDRPSRE